jgi:hypothetical protein
MLKRAFYLVSIVAILIDVAMGQVIAIGPSVTLTPEAKYGSAAFVPGAIVKAHGRTFDTTPDTFSKYQIAISIVPSGQRLRVIQVGTDHVLFALNVASMDGVTGIHLQGFGINEIVPLTGSATPAPAKPTILDSGTYSSEFTAAQPFDGELVFPPLASIITVALHGSDFGSVRFWRVRFVGAERTVDVRAEAIGLGQGNPPLLLMQIGAVDEGANQVTATAENDPAIVSNSVTIFIRR